VHPGIAGRG